MLRLQKVLPEKHVGWSCSIPNDVGQMVPTILDSSGTDVGGCQVGGHPGFPALILARGINAGKTLGLDVRVRIERQSKKSETSDSAAGIVAERPLDDCCPLGDVVRSALHDHTGP